MLDENRKLKFRDSSDCVISCNDCEISVKFMGEDNILDLDESWELVRTPVSFITALEAFTKGIPIYCELINGDVLRYVRFSREEEISFYSIEDQYHIPISSQEILEGAWFIGDYYGE